MDALKIAAVVAGLLAPPLSAAAQVVLWQPLIAEAARRFAVPADWIARVMAAESGGHSDRDGRPLVSRAGAIGLMQVMPDTFADMARLHGLGSDPSVPRDNILAGAAYLRAMYDRFGYPGLFSAYNAGPRRYQAVLDGRETLPAETRAYVARILGTGIAAPVVAVPPSRPTLFSRRSGPERCGQPALFAVAPASLFVTLNGRSGAPD